MKGFGALPFISLSQYGNIKKIYIAREQKKTHGFRQEIEGVENTTPTSKNICLIDDIINSGGSLQKTHHTFSNYGINVDKYLCLVNFTWKEKKINPNLLDAILEVHK
jgi:orotate phosphoribosyltransferase